MNETYVECLVKRKTNILLILLKYLAMMLAGCFIFLWVMGLRSVMLLIAIVFAVPAYLLDLYGEIEYEYLYVDKELVVDRIMNRRRRKRLATYDIGRMEILAPLNSHSLDSYRSRKTQLFDYSSRREQQPDVRYAMFYDGKAQLILEPSPELLKAIQSVAPRKVFR